MRKLFCFKSIVLGVALILMSAGCSVVETVKDKGKDFADAYCCQLSEADREATGNVINDAINPHKLTMQCGDCAE